MNLNLYKKVSTNKYLEKANGEQIQESCNIVNNSLQILNPQVFSVFKFNNIKEIESFIKSILQESIINSYWAKLLLFKDLSLKNLKNDLIYIAANNEVLYIDKQYNKKNLEKEDYYIIMYFLSMANVLDYLKSFIIESQFTENTNIKVLRQAIAKLNIDVLLFFNKIKKILNLKYNIAISNMSKVYVSYCSYSFLIVGE